MPSTNGHGPKQAILYARVSTDEQARSGYSLAQQLEALREYAAREGYEVLEEVSDPGQSGASLERPGMDRVRDLVASEAGGVSVVLAQDRDRFAREPAYHYLLRREFEEYGTKIRALNDRGDESPEGELTDGIMDQLAKYERAKMVERSRRGKLRKAREGKVVAGHTPNYGFRFNESRDGYEVDEEKMAVVRRIFRMVAVEGVNTRGVARTLEREGEPNPGGSRYWYKHVIKRFILDDVYKRHSFEEISGLISSDVAAHLDPEKRYGVWWFNRRRTARKQVAASGPNGREYRSKSCVAYKDKAEWIAVPVPDSGVLRELVDAARAVVAEYRSPSKLSGRFWELSGALMRCGECGRAMEPVDRYYKTKSGQKGVICYYRCREGNRRKDTCSNRKSIRSDYAHAAVWDLISGLLTDPDRLREGLDAMIEEQRRSLRGDPDREAKTWLEKLAALDRKRSGYLDLAAEGIMDLDELRSKLADLQEFRETAKRELAAIEGRKQRLEELERDRDVLMERYAEVVPGSLDALTAEERHQLYKMLRLEVVALPDKSLEVRGAIAGVGEGQDGLGIGDPNRVTPSRGLGALELTRTCESQNTQPSELRFHAQLHDGTSKLQLALS
jgi:site-specific DNA recombinase